MSKYLCWSIFFANEGGPKIARGFFWVRMYIKLNPKKPGLNSKKTHEHTAQQTLLEFCMSSLILELGDEAGTTHRQKILYHKND